MADITEVNTLEELENWRLAWQALHGKTPGANFFQTLDWLTIYWKHFGEDDKLRVLVVCSAGKPIGIVPLCVRKRRFRVGVLRVLTYPLDDWGSWYGPISSTPTACLALALQHVADSPRDWDMIDLPWQTEDRRDLGATRTAFKLLELPTIELPYQTISKIDLSGTWEDFLASRTRHWRSELRRQHRRLAEVGKVEYIRYRPAGSTAGDDDPNWKMFADCQKVAAKSWQGTVTNGNTISHAYLQNYLRESHVAAARLGMLDMSLITLDKTPIAFCYNYSHNAQVAAVRMGFDRQWESLGPGRILLAKLLEDSFDRGDHQVDLGQGDFDYKRRIRTSAKVSYRVAHFPWHGLRSQVVRFNWMRKARHAG